MANRPGYFEAYYAENKGKINSERKRKYDTDPEYRARVLKASQDYRAAHRNEDRIRMPRYQKPLVKKAGDGGRVILFSAGAVAAYLDRSVQAINHWERAGILPPTPYRDERDFRYYTTDMMAAVYDAVGIKRRLFPVDEGMRLSIQNAWKEMGVPIKAQSMKAALAATVTGGRRTQRPRREDSDRIRMPRFQKPLIMEAGDGGDVALFSIGAMAVYLDRSVQAINHWERAGILPPTPYRDERDFRYYTADMMAAVRDAVGNKWRLFPVDESICANIQRAWKEAGVPIKAQSMKSALAVTVTGGRKRRKSK